MCPEKVMIVIKLKVEDKIPFCSKKGPSKSAIGRSCSRNLATPTLCEPGGNNEGEPKKPRFQTIGM